MVKDLTLTRAQAETLSHVARWDGAHIGNRTDVSSRTVARPTISALVARGLLTEDSTGHTARVTDAGYTFLGVRRLPTTEPPVQQTDPYLRGVAAAVADRRVAIAHLHDHVAALTASTGDRWKRAVELNAAQAQLDRYLTIEAQETP